MSKPAAVQYIPVSQIKPNPWNRTAFDPQALEELAASIKIGGIEEPLIIRQKGSQRYEIASGHRRWLAAQKAGLPEVPCLVRDLTDQKVAEMNIEVNVQRENLALLDLSRMVYDYMNRFGTTQEQAAEKFGKPRTWVTELIGFLPLATLFQGNVAAATLRREHLRLLKQLPSKEQEQIATELKDGNLKIENIQKRCNQIRFTATRKPNPQGQKSTPAQASDPLSDLWEPLQVQALATGKWWGVEYGPRPIPMINGAPLPCWQFWVVDKGMVPRAELKRWFLQMAAAMDEQQPGDSPQKLKKTTDPAPDVIEKTYRVTPEQIEAILKSQRRKS